MTKIVRSVLHALMCALLPVPAAPRDALQAREAMAIRFAAIARYGALATAGMVGLALSKMLYFFHGDVNLTLTVLDHLSLSTTALYMTLSLVIGFAINIMILTIFTLTSPRSQATTKTLLLPVVGFMIVTAVTARLWDLVIVLILSYVGSNIYYRFVAPRFKLPDLDKWAVLAVAHDNDDARLREVAEEIRDGGSKLTPTQRSAYADEINARVNELNEHPVSIVIRVLSAYAAVFLSVLLTLPPVLSATYLVELSSGKTAAFVLDRSSAEVLIVPLSTREPVIVAKEHLRLEPCASSRNAFGFIIRKPVDWKTIQACHS